MDGTKLNKAMERQYQALLSKAFFILGSEQDAEDVLQNAYLKAWLHRDSLRMEANDLAWLNRIVYNECMSCLRCRKRQPLCMSDEQLQSFPAQHHNTEHCLDEMSLEVLFNALSEKQRYTFYLRYALGYGIAETARKANITEGTVKSQMYYARQKLKSIYS